MKLYYLLIWIEIQNKSTERRHAWFNNSADALRNYRIALERNYTDVMVLQIRADSITEVKTLIDGSPF